MRPLQIGDRPASESSHFGIVFAPLGGTRPHEAAAWDSLAEPLREDAGLYGALDEYGELIGYCCLGEGARPAGLEEDPGLLDVSVVLRPDLRGIGLGALFLRAVCELGRTLHEPEGFRVSAPAADRAAGRVAAALGFVQSGSYATPEAELALFSRLA